MEALLAVAGFLTVAAITPGPNNFIVMAAATRGGLSAAAPPAAGVIVGSLILLVLVWAGAGSAFEFAPFLRVVMVIAGAGYLVWLGGVLIWRTRRAESIGGPRKDSTFPSTVFGVAAFQFLNPKSWVLVLTATAAITGGAEKSAELAALGVLAVMFCVIPCLCMALWGYVGSAIADWLKRPVARRWFDRIMGGLLIVSAALLVI